MAALGGGDRSAGDGLRRPQGEDSRDGSDGDPVRDPQGRGRRGHPPGARRVPRVDRPLVAERHQRRPHGRTSARSQRAEDPLLHRRGRRARRRRHRPLHQQGRDPRRGGRVRLRQERDRAQHHAADPHAARPHRRGLDHLQRPQPAGAQSGPDAQDPRQGDLDDLPGADDLAQPRVHVRRADRRGHPPARGAGPPRRDGQDGRDAEARAHPQRRAAGEGVSAPALGRHAPARS